MRAPQTLRGAHSVDARFTLALQTLAVMDERDARQVMALVYIGAGWCEKPTRST